MKYYPVAVIVIMTLKAPELVIDGETVRFRVDFTVWFGFNTVLF